VTDDAHLLRAEGSDERPELALRHCVAEIDAGCRLQAFLRPDIDFGRRPAHRGGYRRDGYRLQRIWRVSSARRRISVAENCELIHCCDDAAVFGVRSVAEAGATVIAWVALRQQV